MKYCTEVASSIVGAGSSPTFSMLVVIKPDKVGLFVALSGLLQITATHYTLFGAGLYIIS